MSREKKSKKYQGVYYRELDGGDRSYFLRVRLGGGTRRIPIGKKSEGITEAFCAQEKARIVNEHRFGNDVAAQLARVKATEPTFAELLDFYLENSDIRASTIANVKTLKAVPFASQRRVSVPDVQKYIDGLKPRLRATTINQRLKYLRMIFRFAIAKGKYNHADPTQGVELLKSEKARQRYLAADEVRLLLDTVRAENKPRLYLFVKLALCTGARVSTLLLIHEKDIKPDGSVRLKNTKIDRYYTGFLDEETQELVKGRKGYILAPRGKEDKPPGAHIYQRVMKRILDDLFNPPGTPIEERVVTHTLRHSVASQLLAKGVPMEVIAKTLDHSDIVTTARIYAKVAPELVRRSTINLWD